jgi:hypothetical protein
MPSGQQVPGVVETGRQENACASPPAPSLSPPSSPMMSPGSALGSPLNSTIGSPSSMGGLNFTGPLPRSPPLSAFRECELPDSFAMPCPALSLRLGLQLEQTANPFITSFCREPSLLSDGANPSTWKEIGRTNPVRSVGSVEYDAPLKVPWLFSYCTQLMFEVRSEDVVGKRRGPLLGMAYVTVDELVLGGSTIKKLDIVLQNSVVVGSLTISALPSFVEDDETALINGNWLPDEDAEAQGVAPYIPEWFPSSALSLPAWLSKKHSDETFVSKMLILSAKAELSSDFSILSKKKKKKLLSSAGLSARLSLCDNTAASSASSRKHISICSTEKGQPNAGTGLLVWPDVLVSEMALHQGDDKVYLLSVWADSEVIGACTVIGGSLFVGGSTAVVGIYACSPSGAILVDSPPLMSLTFRFRQAETSRSEGAGGEDAVDEEVQREYRSYVRGVLQFESRLLAKHFKRELWKRSRNKQILNMLFGKIQVVTRFYLDYSVGNGNFVPSSSDPNSFLHYGGAGNPGNPYSALMRALANAFIHLSATGVQAFSYGCALAQRDDISSGGHRRWARGSEYLSTPAVHLRRRSRHQSDVLLAPSHKPVASYGESDLVWASFLAGSDEDKKKHRSALSSGEFSLPSSPRSVPYCLPLEAHLAKVTSISSPKRWMSPKSRKSGLRAEKMSEWEAEAIDEVRNYATVADLITSYDASWQNLNPAEYDASVLKVMHHALESCEEGQYNQVLIMASVDIDSPNQLDSVLQKVRIAQMHPPSTSFSLIGSTIFIDVQASRLPISFIVVGMESYVCQGFPNLRALSKNIFRLGEKAAAHKRKAPKICFSFIMHHTWAGMLVGVEDLAKSNPESSDQGTASSASPKFQAGVDIEDAPLTRARIAKVLAGWDWPKAQRNACLEGLRPAHRNATLSRGECASAGMHQKIHIHWA